MNWYLAALKKYAVFNGRASKKEYWMFFLFNLTFAVVAIILDNILGTAYEGLGYGTIYFLYVLVMLIPGLAVTVRRLHDIGKKGGMILITAIPIIGAVWLLVLMTFDSVQQENQYGPNPKEEIASLNKVEPVMKMEEKFTKRVDFHIFTGIIGFGLVLILIKSFISKETSSFKNIDYDKVLIEAEKVINKDCPIMIDQETRLNNVMAEPGKEILYNITLLNYDKELFEKDSDKYITVEELRNTNEPIIINMAKTSPIVKSFRENKVTMIYHYSDKNGVFLFEIVITPDQYITEVQDIPVTTPKGRPTFAELAQREAAGQTIPSTINPQTDVETFIMNEVREGNKICPYMVDSEIRLENMTALPPNTIQFNYTLVNWVVKESLNNDDFKKSIDELKRVIEPELLNGIKTSPDLNKYREKKITIIIDLRDKNSVFLFETVVTPDMYKN